MKFERTSITLPQPVMKAGKNVAKQRNRNFSSYLADLIATDARRVAATKGGGKEGPALSGEEIEGLSYLGAAKAPKALPPKRK